MCQTDRGIGDRSDSDTLCRTLNTEPTADNAAPIVSRFLSLRFKFRRLTDDGVILILHLIEAIGHEFGPRFKVSPDGFLADIENAIGGKITGNQCCGFGKDRLYLVRQSLEQIIGRFAGRNPAWNLERCFSPCSMYCRRSAAKRSRAGDVVSAIAPRLYRAMSRSSR